MTRSRKFAALLIFAAGILFGLSMVTFSKFFLTANSVYAYTASTNSGGINPSDDDFFKYSRVLAQTYQILKQEFVDPTNVSAKHLFYGALKGMMESSGDPYTVFMEPEESKSFNEEIAGSFGGVGITIDVRDGWLTVISPLEDTPAWKAGISSGDQILEIDGVTAKDITMEETMKRLRGKPGSKVKLLIRRDGLKDNLPVVLVREEIKIKTVKTRFITNESIAYVRITEFSRTTADDFKKGLQNLLAMKPKGLIVDLRNNPGGLIDQVSICADYFLDSGLIVYTRGRNPDNNSDVFATKEVSLVPPDLPLVVLINGGSASASEIFSGAMLDTGRGVLVGQKSYGKGSVQSTYVFPEDGSLIKYTIAKYYTPSGICIDRKGLMPNVEVQSWLEQLPDMERSSMIKLQDTSLIRGFVQKNPDPKRTELEQFRSELAAKGYTLSPKSLQYLMAGIRYEKALQPPLLLEFDDQLSKAVTVLTNYRAYKRETRVFQQAK